MAALRTTTAYAPTGDQPAAIETLAAGCKPVSTTRRSLGATGTGKTATMAWIIEKVGRPALVIAHNKTLAAQLCNEFREFFPDNAVEYFVSYYDYYQPEAYVPQADLYIEKDSSHNDDIERLRHAATSNLLSRRDFDRSSRRSRASTASARRRSGSERIVYPRTLARSRTAMPCCASSSNPVRAQRHGARPRPLPCEGRRARDPAGQLGDRLPRLVLRRRGRADHALRPAHGRGASRARHDRGLAGDAVRHLASRRSSAPWSRFAPSSRRR